MARPVGSKDPKPEIERKVELACKRISERGIKYLEDLIEKALDPETPKEQRPDPRWVMMAIDQVLNRGFGKPRQQIDQSIQVEGGDALIDAIRKAKDRVAVAIAAGPAVPDDSQTTTH
jgi:hypothetical protein